MSKVGQWKSASAAGALLEILRYPRSEISSPEGFALPRLPERPFRALLRGRLPEFPWLWSQATTVPWVCGAGGMRLPLPRLWRHPFHGSPERKPCGIPVAVVCDHGAVVSTGFPSPDAGWVPAAPATWASGACHLLSQSNGGAAVGRTKRGITSFTCVRAAESVRRPGLARSSGDGRAHPLGNASYFRFGVNLLGIPPSGPRPPDRFSRPLWRCPRHGARP